MTVTLRVRGDAVALCNICKWHPHHCHRLSFVFPKCHRNKSLICSADKLLIASSAVPRGGRKDKSKGGKDFYFCVWEGGLAGEGGGGCFLFCLVFWGAFLPRSDTVTNMSVMLF